MIRLPDLPYAYDALAPVISETTLRTHHGKHHANYVAAVNALTPHERPEPLEGLIRQAALSGGRKLFNNAAQSWNHGFFWNCMTPTTAPPGGALAEAIETGFGGLASLRAAFLAEGTAHFGSGWVWLVAKDGRLSLFSTHDADTVVTRDVTPLLVCDLWEHAYYLDHRNDRAGFLEAWWDRLANWGFAQSQFAAEAAGSAGWRYPVASAGPPQPAPGRHPLEDALDEAFSLLDARPEPGSLEDRRLLDLVEGIARHGEAVASGDGAELRPDLDRRIREAARRMSEERQHGDDHWSPMVGGAFASPPPDAAGRRP